MSDLYVFANGQVFGLTPCAPIIDFLASQNENFVAALCLDINPSGSLDSYYVFELKDKATYMLYNEREDEKIDEMDASDDTQFMQFLNQVINEKVRDESYFDGYKITGIKTYSAIARLYDNEQVKWGKVSFTTYYTSSSNTTDAGAEASQSLPLDQEVEQEYWFNVNAL